MNSTPPPRAPRSGFTLIELLAVVAVIAVVIAFAVPATNQILRGSQLSQGGQLLGDQIAFARQLALTKNRTTEFRFYRFGDPETPGEKYDDPTIGRWRGFQVFELMQNGAAVPATPFQRMPRMTILDGEKFSTLLNRDYVGEPRNAEEDSTAPELPVEINGLKVAKKYQFVSFKFLPDGSTNLPPKARKSGGGGSNDDSDTWYVTVVSLADAGKELRGINYSTIQIDPFTGSQKVFRPTLGERR